MFCQEDNLCHFTKCTDVLVLDCCYSSHIQLSQYKKYPPAQTLGRVRHSYLWSAHSWHRHLSLLGCLTASIICRFQKRGYFLSTCPFTDFFFPLFCLETVWHMQMWFRPEHQHFLALWAWASPWIWMSFSRVGSWNGSHYLAEWWRALSNATKALTITPQIFLYTPFRFFFLIFINKP